jgi:hypothetical protein
MKQKVLIGWPDGGSVHGMFTKSMLALQHYELSNPSDSYRLMDPIRAEGLYVTENRNELVRQALDAKADWLLQIDGDESFSPDLLRILMRTADEYKRPVVVGVYANIGSVVENGGFNIVDCIYAETDDGQYRGVVPPDNMQPFQVDAAGTGIFLTHMSVFKKISAPWFWLEMIQLPSKKVQFMNEDIAFCRILREHGFPIWCDPLAEAIHWKRLPLVASQMGKFIKKAQDTLATLNG